MKNQFWHKKPIVTSLLCIGAIHALCVAAMAITVPVAGTFAYDAWDIFVVQGIKGAIGASVVVALVGLGAYEFKQSPMAGGATIVTGAIIAKADTVASTLGAILS